MKVGDETWGQTERYLTKGTMAPGWSMEPLVGAVGIENNTGRKLRDLEGRNRRMLSLTTIHLSSLRLERVLHQFRREAKLGWSVDALGSAFLESHPAVSCQRST